MVSNQVHTAPDGAQAASLEARAALEEVVDAARVRNYDHWKGHSVHVRLAGADGEVRFAERVYLAPGQSARLSGALDPGEYELRVQVDGVERSRTDCRLDGTETGTAVVELGNGVVSVTEGAP